MKQPVPVKLSPQSSWAHFKQSKSNYRKYGNRLAAQRVSGLFVSDPFCRSWNRFPWARPPLRQFYPSTPGGCFCFCQLTRDY